MREPGDDLADRVRGLDLPERPGVDAVRQRVRRRRWRKRAVAGAAVAGVAALIAVPNLDRGSSITTTDPATPSVDGPVPAPDGTWTWVESARLVARDGSSTGYALREFADSNDLLVYLDDGALCVNAGTCGSSQASFDDDAFERRFADPDSPVGAIFDLPAPDNPFAGWNAVVLPHTTGDLYSGANPTADIPGVEEPQAQVGALNMIAMLDELAASHGDRIDRLVVAGTGAGGFGALLNHEVVIERFPGVEVTIIVDSAIIALGQDVLSNCLLTLVTQGWDRTYPEDWDEFVRGDYDQRLGGMYEYASRKYPNARFALFAASDDAELQSTLSAGAESCGLPSVTPERFAAAVTAVSELLAGYANWDMVIVPGDDHGFLDAQVDADQQLGAVATGLLEWLAEQVDHRNDP